MLKNETYIGNMVQGCKCGYPMAVINRCACHSIKEENVNEAVLTKVREVCQAYLDQERLRPIAEEEVEKAKKAAKCEAEIQSLQSKITAMTTKLDRMYMDRLNGLLPEEDFQRIYQKVKMDRAVLEDRLKNLQNQLEQPVSAEEKARALVKQFLDSAFSKLRLSFGQIIYSRCALMCKEVSTHSIGVHGTYTLERTDNEEICIHCGQCANVCTVDRIVEKYEYPDVKKAISGPYKIVIVSTLAAVRAALGEEFRLTDGSFVQGKMVALLRALGAAFVLDTCVGAELTIVEEAGKIIERVMNNKAPLPQFTSCCSAWVKFVETYYSEMIPNLFYQRVLSECRGRHSRRSLRRKKD